MKTKVYLNGLLKCFEGLSSSSASSHFCIVVWLVAITQFELDITHTCTVVKKIYTFL